MMFWVTIQSSWPKQFVGCLSKLQFHIYLKIEKITIKISIFKTVFFNKIILNKIIKGCRQFSRNWTKRYKTCQQLVTIWIQLKIYGQQ